MRQANIFQTNTLKIVRLVIIFLLIFHATIFVARFISNASAKPQNAMAESSISTQVYIDAINAERNEIGLPKYSISNDLSDGAAYILNTHQAGISETSKVSYTDVAWNVFPSAGQVAGATIACGQNISETIKLFENPATTSNIIIGDFNRIGLAIAPTTDGCIAVHIVASA